MEFYGSIDSVSGSITASLFTGSFKGDGGGLYNLPASGVTGLNLSQIASGNATASISSTGFTVNKNTQIQGNLSVTGSIIATNYIVSSSVTYMTTSFASGSSMFGNDNNDVHQFTGSVAIAGTLSLNGIAVGVGKLDETTFQSYTSSLSSSIGSLSSSIALTDVSQSNRLTTIEGNYVTTGSNLFKGSQTISGSIIPSVDNTYDLGSSTYQWRDVYISSGSLYIDGTKVLGSTSQELTITTDTGQSIKILEAGSDSIILQSADGDIELKSSGGGDILFDPTSGLISIKGTTQIQDGFKITSSGGNSIVFGDSVIVSGSIELTGNVDGIDLQSFSSSVSASISSLLGGNTSLSSSIATTTSGLSSSIGSLSSSVATTTSGLSSSVATTTSGLSSSVGSLSSSVATTTSGLSSSINSLSSSVATTTSGLSSSIGALSSSIATTTVNTKNRVDSIETTTGSLNTFSSSINTTIKSKLDSESVISGSVQVVITGTTGYSTFSSSVSTSIGALSSSVATTTSGLNSSIGSLSSSVATTTSGLSSSIGSLSSSVATTTSGLSSSIGSLSSSIATTTLGTKNRVDSIEAKTGSYATTGSNIFIGSQTITGSLYISQDLIVAGSSSIQHISSSVVNIGDNIITVNAQNPSIRFGGLAVIDSGSSPSVSGSMLFDSVNDQWIFVHQNQSSVTSSVLLMGPQTFNSLGSESYPTTNRLLKSLNAEHIGDSNISDNGTTVTILSNTIVNGTFSATGTTLVSGSGQISFNGITDKPTLVSGSSQVSFNGITDKPTLVSGSSQIAYGSITGVPSGLVSGSSQISLASTTGFGTYINQALLTTSTPTFSTVSATTFTGALSGNATTATTAGALSSMNISQFTNNSGYLTSAANWFGASSTGGNLDWNASTNTKPGSGDTLLLGNATNGFSVNAYYHAFNLEYNTKDGSGNVTQLAISYGTPGDDLRMRGRYGGTWSSWVRFLNSSNYTTFASPLAGSTSLTTLGTVTTGTWNATPISNTYLANSSFYVGTTSISLGRGSASQTLTGVSIDGNATTATTAGALSSMNISQFTNNSAYIKVNDQTYFGINNTSSSSGNGISLYGSYSGGEMNYGIMFAGTPTFGTHGSVSGDWATYFMMNNDNTRGWIFRKNGTANVASISGGGNASFTGTITASNFSGSHSGTSSGTNTGDQTNISGNAATATFSTSTSRLYSTDSAYNYSSANPYYGYLTYDGSRWLFQVSPASPAAVRVSYADSAGSASTATTAGNITAYTINQSVGTGNSPTFVDQTLSGRLNFGNTGATPYVNPTGTGCGISFGGWESSSLRTYGIFTEQENIGGNYSKLTFNYHTGIRFGASSSYGGVRFYNNYVGGSGGGSEIFSVGNGDNNVRVTANLLPTINNNSNLGSASLGWANVYTNDLHLSNMNKFEGNDVDGTNGTWTIQEGAENLYIINNNNGKKYKIDLTEII